METIILNYSLKFVLKVATFGLVASSYVGAPLLERLVNNTLTHVYPRQSGYAGAAHQHSTLLTFTLYTCSRNTDQTL